MRVPSLAFFFVTIIILIALMEYACHALPVASSKGIISGLLNVTSIIKRQNYANNYTSTIVTRWVAPNSVL
jgi:transcriptional regulator of acetoin/glycerol metabolism